MPVPENNDSASVENFIQIDIQSRNFNLRDDGWQWWSIVFKEANRDCYE